jgi:DNA-binding beta-propeller fold protein YncE
VPAVFLAASLIWSATVTAQTAGAPLVLETKIPLGQVGGRIDHLGIDVKRQRLFVAELGNNSLGVVDLAAGKLLRTVAGLSEPQGVAYVPFADSVFVANAGDGSVHILRGDDLAPIGRIELGEDADNVRVDTQRNRVLVGYGNGALAVIDPATRTSQDGRVVAKVETCGDADDVFVDPKRHRVYVSCGEGVIDVLELREAEYRRLARVPTVSGARTSLFVPELDRLFVAVRARSGEPAAIWVFRPLP